MNTSDIILEIKDLCVEFQTTEGTVRAVNRLDYFLRAGEKLGIVGESGSGKSVFSLGIMGLIPNPPGRITKGQILYKGKDLVHFSEKEMQSIRGNEISMIFQEPMTSLNPIITCGKQIAESLRIHRGLSKKEAMEEAIRMMRAVGIANAESRAGEYPHQMSCGMRQRFMTAMALACQPRILIADEPTTALDVTIQAQILDLIRKLNEDFGTAVIFINWLDVSYNAFGKKDAQYLIPNEFELNPEIKPLDSHPGVVCMGGYGAAGLAGCEFFFPLRDCPEHKGINPVFGRVVEGMDEIWRLGKVKTVPVAFPIEGVEVNEPVEPDIILRVGLELYGKTYPNPVKVENPELPPCWTNMK